MFDSEIDNCLEMNFDSMNPNFMTSDQPYKMDGKYETNVIDLDFLQFIRSEESVLFDNVKIGGIFSDIFQDLEMSSPYDVSDSSVKMEETPQEQTDPYKIASSISDINAVLIKAQEYENSFESLKRPRSPKYFSSRLKRSNIMAKTEDDSDDEDGREVSELEQKRARNRMHAKKSRTRKKVAMENLEEELARLRSENLGLRQLVLNRLPEKAHTILKSCSESSGTSLDIVQVVSELKEKSGSDTHVKLEQYSPQTNGNHNRVKAVPNALTLMDPDFCLIESLRVSQQNFVLLDPHKINNPIVFASPGFLAHTGYASAQVLGMSLQFITGPATDPTSLDILSNNLTTGQETSLCLLCYRANGSLFWNQLYIGALRNQTGSVTNLIACMSEVATLSTNEFRHRLHHVPLPDDLIKADNKDLHASEKVRIEASEAARSASAHYSNSSCNSTDLKCINVSPFMKAEYKMSFVKRSLSKEDLDCSAKEFIDLSHPKVVDPLRRTRSSIRAVKNGTVF